MSLIEIIANLRYAMHRINWSSDDIWEKNIMSYKLRGELMIKLFSWFVRVVSFLLKAYCLNMD